MNSTLMIAAVAVMMVAPANRAGADPVPKIDWQQLEQSLGGTGDHVVGEELCAAPGRHDRGAG